MSALLEPLMRKQLTRKALAREALPREPIAKVPGDLVASGPPESRGLTRDTVRLLVAAREAGTVEHATFRDLPRFLDPGDLLVVNTSATIPAAIPTLDGRLLHLSTRLPGGAWVVEVRRPLGDGSAAELGARPGERLVLPGGGGAELLAGYPLDRPHPDGVRLWLAALRLPQPLLHYLGRHARPIRYAYTVGAWPLRDYQSVFATEPGSVEMPSAGRGFTPELLTALVAKGVGVTPLVLHTGVSSQDAGEPPYAEQYRVPPETAARVNATRAAGGRVIAVGTTVTRALETVTGPDGRAAPGAGWTELMVTPERGVRALDALLTGWHAPEASHLALLEAVAGQEILRASYAAALAERYLWHEFGDLHLLLP